MKKYFSFLFLLWCSNTLAQTPELTQSEDSIYKISVAAKTVEAKCNSYMEIAKLYTGQNKDKEIEYINKSIFEAEQTRDRKLMARVYKKVAEQWLYLGSNLERREKALTIIDKGLLIAKEAQLNEETAVLLQKKGLCYRLMGKLSDAIKFHEESINYIDLTNNDSLKILLQNSYANTLVTKDENLAAFKKYMYTLNYAESLKNEKEKLTSYGLIANFYAKIKQTEKAKDYFIKAINQAKLLKDSASEMGITQSIISLYAVNKDFAIAREYLKVMKSRVGKNETFKRMLVGAELQIIYYEDVKNLPEFFKKNSDLYEEYKKYGMLAEVDKLKGIIYSLENKMDSALYHLNLSKKQTNQLDISNVIDLNEAYAFYLDKSKKYKEAAIYFEMNVPLSKQIQSLSKEKETYEALDSIYMKAGDKQKEAANKLLLFSIKDSLDKQQKANDLLGIEIDLDNKRTEREKIDKEEKVLKRNNLQYMGISAFIFALFVALAAMGKFKVKPWFIKALGFISFILLFEFIILLIDHQLHVLTHGEPLPILLVKIVIIAFLLPFHHWLEHKVMKYLTQHMHVAKTD